eukprot:scaffold1736_cov127-Cylindrotheca_fusiformis.AAC.38
MDVCIRYQWNSRKFSSMVCYNKEDPGNANPAPSGSHIDYVGLEESLQAVAKELATLSTDDDISSIMGFSQGAVFAHILASKARQSIPPFDKIHKLISISGFPATPLTKPRYDCDNVLAGIDIPSSHRAFVTIDDSVPQLAPVLCSRHKHWIIKGSPVASTKCTVCHNDSVSG